MSDIEVDRSPERQELDALIEDTNSLIASVYSMYDQPLRTSLVITPLLARRSCENSDISSAIGSNANSPKSPKTPHSTNRHSARTPSRSEIDRDINRIDRFCEMLEQNLRSATLEQEQMEERRRTMSSLSSPGRLTANTSAAESHHSHSSFSNEVIDLCDTTNAQVSTPYAIQTYSMNSSDDVIVLTPLNDDVIDLCTPTSTNRNRRLSNTNRSTHSTSNRNTARRRLIASHRFSTPNAVRSRRCCSTSSTANVEIAGIPVEAMAIGEPNQKSNTSSDVQGRDGRVPFMCAVCMESCVNNQPTSTKCGHVFCAKCINKAIQLTRKCPMCNTKLTPRMIFRIYI